MPFLGFFSPQTENAIFILRAFSITRGDGRWREILVLHGHPGFLRGPRLLNRPQEISLALYDLVIEKGGAPVVILIHQSGNRTMHGKKVGW